MTDLCWTATPLTLTLTWDDDRPVCLADIVLPDARRRPRPDRSHQPLVEIASPDTGDGTFSNTGRWTNTEIGSRLRHVAHRADENALVIEQVDATTGVRVITTLRSPHDVAALSASSVVSLDAGHSDVRLWGVTSLATGAVISDDPQSLDVWSGASTWAAEHRWSCEPLRSPGLARIDAGGRGETINASLGRTVVGTKSSEGWVPPGSPLTGRPASLWPGRSKTTAAGTGRSANAGSPAVTAWTTCRSAPTNRTAIGGPTHPGTGCT